MVDGEEDEEDREMTEVIETKVKEELEEAREDVEKEQCEEQEESELNVARCVCEMAPDVMSGMNSMSLKGNDSDGDTSIEDVDNVYGAAVNSWASEAPSEIWTSEMSADADEAYSRDITLEKRRFASFDDFHLFHVVFFTYGHPYGPIWTRISFYIVFIWFIYGVYIVFI